MTYLKILALALVCLFLQSEDSFAKPKAKAAAGNASTITYQARWVRVGGDWKLDWNKGQAKQVCGHADNCNCHGKNSCGEAKPGQIVSYWPNGCDKPEWKIKCEATLEGAADPAAK